MPLKSKNEDIFLIKGGGIVKYSYFSTDDTNSSLMTMIIIMTETVTSVHNRMKNSCKIPVAMVTQFQFQLSRMLAQFSDFSVVVMETR